MTVFSTNRVTFSPLFSNSASAVWARNNSRLAFLMAKCKTYRFEPFPFFALFDETRKGFFFEEMFHSRLVFKTENEFFCSLRSFSLLPENYFLARISSLANEDDSKARKFYFQKSFLEEKCKMHSKKNFPPISFSLSSLFFTGTQRNGNSPLPQKHIKPQSGSLFSPSLGCGDGWLCGLWMEPPRFLGLVLNPKKGSGGERRSSKTLCWLRQPWSASIPAANKSTSFVKLSFKTAKSLKKTKYANTI